MSQTAAHSVTTMPLVDLLRDYADGDEHGWEVEFAWLAEHHKDRLTALESDVRVDGIREPIVLGSDGRVWDGHHRLAVACRLKLPCVPVTKGSGGDCEPSALVHSAEQPHRTARAPAPPDMCPLGCGHGYHGLPCTKHIHTGGWFPDAGRVCGCPGPWDAA